MPEPEETLHVTLVRHGETYQNHQHVVQGQDPTLGRLTPRGRLQATLLGRALAEEPFDMVYTSTLERAVLTMGLVLMERPGERTLPIRFAEPLREINLGVLHGVPHQEWKASIVGDPVRFRPDGGESWLDLQARVSDYFRRVVLAGGHRRILVVAHGGVNRAVISSLTGMPMVRAWQGPGIGTPQANTCINRFVLDPAGRLLSCHINDTRHLAEADEAAGLGQRWLPAEGRWELLEPAPPEVNEFTFQGSP